MDRTQDVPGGPEHDDGVEPQVPTGSGGSGGPPGWVPQGPSGGTGTPPSGPEPPPEAAAEVVGLVAAARTVAQAEAALVVQAVAVVSTVRERVLARQDLVGVALGPSAAARWRPIPSGARCWRSSWPPASARALPGP